MNGQSSASACDMVVKVVSDLGRVGEILEEVETETERLVLDMRSLPEEEMQVFSLIISLVGVGKHGLPPGEAVGGGAGMPCPEGGTTLAAKLAKKVQGGCVEAAKDAGDQEPGERGGDG